MVSIKQYRDQLLTIHKTAAWAILSPEELDVVYRQTKLLMGTGGGLDEIEYTSLMELLFHLCIIRSEDMQAETLYKTLRDRFGEDSPRLHLMKATLLQVNESDEAARKYIEDLISKQLNIATDVEDYVQLKKKLLVIDRPTFSQKEWIQSLLDLVEEFPLDAELWSMLSKEYESCGNIDQAIYCMEEVIVAMPFNYEAFGEVACQYLKKAIKDNDSHALKSCLDNALRSVEMAEKYVKGWSLVFLASEKLKKENLVALAKRKLQQMESENGNEMISTVSKYILSN